MTRALRAELLKLRTARTFWALAGATVGLVVLITVLTLALTDEFRTENEVRSVLSTAGASGLLMLVLGVVASAGEYRHGTIASTLLFTPRRLRVMAAQALACGVTGLVVGLAAAALTAAIALPWLSAKGAPSLSTGELLGLFSGAACTPRWRRRSAPGWARCCATRSSPWCSCSLCCSSSTRSSRAWWTTTPSSP